MRSGNRSFVIGKAQYRKFILTAGWAGDRLSPLANRTNIVRLILSVQLGPFT